MVLPWFHHRAESAATMQQILIQQAFCQHSKNKHDEEKANSLGESDENNIPRIVQIVDTELILNCLYLRLPSWEFLVWREEARVHLATVCLHYVDSFKSLRITIEILDIDTSLHLVDDP